MPAAVRIADIVRLSLMVVALTSLIVLTAELLILHERGEKLLSVQTASMVPTFRPGDALIVAPAAWQSLRVGEVISYASPRDPQVIISHRLVKMDKAKSLLTTAGDARQTPDPVFPATAVIGRVVAIAPGLGNLLNMLRIPWVMILVVFVPSAVLLYAELVRLMKYITKPLYQIRGYKS